jgi:hypothetical protein
MGEACSTYYNIFVENLKERDYSENPGLDRKIILEWILGK